MPFLFVPLKMPFRLVKKNLNGTVDVKTKENLPPHQKKFSCLNELLFFIKCFI